LINIATADNQANFLAFPACRVLQQCSHASRTGALGQQFFLRQQTDDQNVIRILDDARPVPNALRFHTTFSVDSKDASRWSNALVVFDYKSPKDFKFAGAFVGINELAIGRMTSRGYILDSIVRENLEENTQYRLEVQIDGKRVSLALDGTEKLEWGFPDELRHGKLGLLTLEDSACFKDVFLSEIEDDVAANQ